MKLHRSTDVVLWAFSLLAIVSLGLAACAPQAPAGANPVPSSDQAVAAATGTPGPAAVEQIPPTSTTTPRPFYPRPIFFRGATVKDSGTLEIQNRKDLSAPITGHCLSDDLQQPTITAALNQDSQVLAPDGKLVDGTYTGYAVLNPGTCAYEVIWTAQEIKQAESTFETVQDFEGIIVSASETEIVFYQGSAPLDPTPDANRLEHWKITPQTLIGGCAANPTLKTGDYIRGMTKTSASLGPGDAEHTLLWAADAGCVAQAYVYPQATQEAQKNAAEYETRVPAATRAIIGATLTAILSTIQP